MTRRTLLRLAAAGAFGAAVDVDRLLWVPGAKTWFLPPERTWIDQQAGEFLRQLQQALGRLGATVAPPVGWGEHSRMSLGAPVQYHIGLHASSPSWALATASQSMALALQRDCGKRLSLVAPLLPVAGAVRHMAVASDPWSSLSVRAVCDYSIQTDETLLRFDVLAASA